MHMQACSKVQWQCRAIRLMAVLLFVCVLLPAVSLAAVPSYQVLTPIQSNLLFPTSVAVGPDERVYVAESSQDHVQVYDASGRYQTTLSGLEMPISVTAGPDGLLYVGNAGRGNVEIYSSDFALIGELGQGSEEFRSPTGIAVDGDGNVYVTDGDANRIKVYKPDFTLNFSFGSAGTLNGQFQMPTAISVNEVASELYVTDLAVAFSWTGGSARVQVFGLDGAFKRSFKTQDGTDTPFVRPLGVVLDEAGRVYVTDSYQNNIAIYSDQGAYLGSISDPNQPLFNPMGMAYAPGTNRLFVASLNSASVETYGIEAQYSDLVLAPASHDFGEVEIGGQSGIQGFDVSNNGDADLVIGAVDISGANADDFAFMSDNCSDQTLMPGDSCLIEVFFSPVSPGDKSANLSILNNDVYEPEAIAALGGAGVLPQYMLSVAKDGVGSGSVYGLGINCGVECAQSFAAGSLVTLTAMPQIGSKFDGWSGGNCSGTGSCVVTLNSDVNVTALFSPAPITTYTVSASAGSGGSISPAGDTLAAAGTIVSFTITPDIGYRIADVIVDGASEGAQSYFSFVNLSADHAIQAHFEVNPPLTSVLEMGEVSVNHNWTRVTFNKSFVDPVVVANPASYNGSDPGGIRLRNVDATGFDIRFQEWNYLDGKHAKEQVSYLVLERGHYFLPDGTQVEAGSFDTAMIASFGAMSFSQVFNTPPIVTASVMTFNGADTVVGRLRNIDASGFEYRMQEQQANAQQHVAETIGYIAWEPSMGVVGGLVFEVAKAADVVSDLFSAVNFNTLHLTPPLFVADMQTTDGADVANLRWRNKNEYSVEVQVDEEQSKDSETKHAAEIVGYMALSLALFEENTDSDGDGLQDIYEVSIYDTDPLAADSDSDGIEDGDELAYWGSQWNADFDGDELINLLDPDADDDGYSDGEEQAAGSDPADFDSVPSPAPTIEAGEAIANHIWKRILFSKTFGDPVVVAKPASYNGGDPAVVRVRNIDSTGFDICIQEWDYRDGVHTNEYVSYIVMERGSHTLADGTLIEAGRFETNATATFTPVSFDRGFNVSPVVTAAVSSFNGVDAVAGRLRNIGVNGFDYRMQEQEANVQAHTIETISYIAWEPSSGVLGGMAFEVSKTTDTVNHYFSPIAFDMSYWGIPAFLADMQTADGGDVANLRWRNKDATGVEVRVNEEQSRDSEMQHTTEVVGYIAIDLGTSP